MLIDAKQIKNLPDPAFGVPVVVHDGETFTIPDNRQVLWAGHHEQEGTGSLNIEGEFVEVA